MTPYGYYPASYNSPYNPYQQAVPQYQQQSSGNGIQWVQGIAGAKAYSLGANQSIQLMDSESQTFYIKTCDASGMPSLRIFDYVERTPQNAPTAPQTGGVDMSLYVTRAELDERIAALRTPTKEVRANAERTVSNAE